MDNLTTAIKNTGTTSNATEADRAQLIKDLIASGVQASTAKTDVDKYITALGKIPKNVATSITVTGDGKWSVQQVASLSKPGGKLSGPTGTATGWLGMFVRAARPARTASSSAPCPANSSCPPRWLRAARSITCGARFPASPTAASFPVRVSPAATRGRRQARAAGLTSEEAATNQAVVTSVEQAMAAAINAKVAAAQAAAAGPAGHVSGSAGQVQSLAQRMAAARGWTGAMWNDLNAVEMREAGWNLNAQNPGSGAYGIAQFINGAE